MTLRAGDLRCKVTIEKPVTAFDEYGDPCTTWEVHDTRRARIQYLNGREYYTAKGHGSEVVANIRMRLCGTATSITPDMRIKDSDGRYFAIEAVIPHPEDRELVIKVTDDDHHSRNKGAA